MNKLNKLKNIVNNLKDKLLVLIAFVFLLIVFSFFVWFTIYIYKNRFREKQAIPFIFGYWDILILFIFIVGVYFFVQWYSKKQKKQLNLSPKTIKILRIILFPFILYNESKLFVHYWLLNNYFKYYIKLIEKGYIWYLYIFTKPGWFIFNLIVSGPVVVSFFICLVLDLLNHSWHFIFYAVVLSYTWMHIIALIRFFGQVYKNLRDLQNLTKTNQNIS